MNKLCIYKTIYILLVFLVSLSYSQDSIELLCGDQLCKKIVAEATAIIKYNSIEKNVLSFNPNDRIRIMGRNIPKGPKFDLVLVEINGRRGWVPFRMIKETRILIRTDQLIQTIVPSPSAVEPEVVPKIKDDLEKPSIPDLPSNSIVQNSEDDSKVQSILDAKDAEGIENEEDDDNDELARLFNEVTEEELIEEQAKRDNAEDLPVPTETPSVKATPDNLDVLVPPADLPQTTDTVNMAIETTVAPTVSQDSLVAAPEENSTTNTAAQIEEPSVLNVAGDLHVSNDTIENNMTEPVAALLMSETVATTFSVPQETATPAPEVNETAQTITDEVKGNSPYQSTTVPISTTQPAVENFPQSTEIPVAPLVQINPVDTSTPISSVVKDQDNLVYPPVPDQKEPFLELQTEKPAAFIEAENVTEFIDGLPLAVNDTFESTENASVTTTQSPPEEITLNPEPMKLTDTTTPPPTTTVVHPDHEVADPSAHEYLNVETTTESLRKIDDVTTTLTPLSAPQGVGNFNEITSPPPASQAKEVSSFEEQTTPPPRQAEVTVTPKSVEKFEVPTTPSPPQAEVTVTPPAKGVGSFEELTTPQPSLAEGIFTPAPQGVGSFDRPASPPPSSHVEEKPAPKGVGSFEELTSAPPPNQSDVISPPAADEPAANVDNIETESFFSGVWKKVTGLFAGGTDENVDTIKTTSQASFDEDLHKILFSSKENVIDVKKDAEIKEEATVKDTAFCAKFSTDPECEKLKTESSNAANIKTVVKEPSIGIKHPLVSNHQHGLKEPAPGLATSPNLPFRSSADTDYIQIIFNEIIEIIDLIVTLALTALVILIFTLGYYCINKSRKEGPLLAKINGLERHLMASLKENTLLKSEVLDTRNKLISIEDNSFGSNDMVIALRKDLDDAEQINQELQDQVEGLEKELENAAEAGLELNKMVSELLSNQSGSDSIISSVEELQRQLNEQQETIVSMNTALANKSRENSELQIIISEQTGKLSQQFEELQMSYDNLKLEKTNVEVQLSVAQQSLNEQMREITESKSGEIDKLTEDVLLYKRKFEETNAAYRMSASRVEALETCVQEMRAGATGELGELMDVAELKADLLAVSKEKDILKESLDGENDARRLLEERVRVVNEEVSQLKKDYTKAEQEKAATQTRLEILSSYFKEKEAQLQKELSVKEAKWMQKQGETTSTVERVRAMQDEIQSLKSQNDSLRAEIEAQSTANKMQNVTLENRAHEAWLNSRQAERKLEEARSEASALRRKLTSMAEVPGGGGGGLGNSTMDDMNNMPSPIRVESPNVPPPMMMPPFMPPPPFMPGLPGIPPPGMPPFMPPGIPPFMPIAGPSGRLMSPPPPNNRYSPNMHSRDRDYSPDRSGRYSPADSRYNYSVMSPYETETDFSPPPSPPRQNYSRDSRDYRDGPRGSGHFGNSKKAYSPPPTKSATNRSSKTKGALSSGSQDSVGPRKGGK